MPCDARVVDFLMNGHGDGHEWPMAQAQIMESCMLWPGPWLLLTDIAKWPRSNVLFRQHCRDIVF
jgi:hypothetical protein